MNARPGSDPESSEPLDTRSSPSPETDFLPIGDGRLDQISQRVHDLGDLAESSGLEAKSDVDLTRPAGKAKVAKFILGMANRSPAVAARHFKGYGVMVLGVAKGSLTGISNPPEEHQLRDGLRKYLGARQPQWGLSTRPVEGNRACVFIIVEPPKDGTPLYLCHAEYQGDGPKDKDSLRDGGIYIRDSTQTREARAHEIEELISRQQQDTGPAVSVKVTATGAATRLTDTEDLRDRLINYRTQQLRDRDAAKDRSPAAELKARNLLGPSYVPPDERMTLEDRITQDTTIARREWGRCHTNLLTGLATRVRLQVVNDAAGYLTDPELSLEIPDARCYEATDPDDLTWYDVTPWPRPRHPLEIYNPPPPIKMSWSHRGECPTDWTEHEDPCRITLKPQGLPPHTPRTASVDLVLEVLTQNTDSLNCTWTLVAANLTDQVTGVLEIPIRTLRTYDLFSQYYNQHGAGAADA